MQKKKTFIKMHNNRKVQALKSLFKEIDAFIIFFL